MENKSVFKNGLPLSHEFLKNRGSCCGHGCLNCPYWPKHTQGNTKIREEEKENTP